jgi:DNA-binding transcriptional MerR regulator
MDVRFNPAERNAPVKIGDLARTTGVGLRSLRYYEEQRLLTAERTSGGHRVYDRDAPERVRLIQSLYAAGLSSRTIALLLPCETTAEVTDEMIDEVQRQHLRIGQRIEEMRSAHQKLGAILGTMRSAAALPGARPDL